MSAAGEPLAEPEHHARGNPPHSLRLPQACLETYFVGCAPAVAGFKVRSAIAG